MNPTGVGAGVATVLLVACLTACTGGDDGPEPSTSRSASQSTSRSTSPTSPLTTLAAPPCDAEALRNAPRLTAAIAQEVSGAGVRVCTVVTGSGGSPTYEVTQVGPEAAASPEHARMVRLTAVDGGALPPDCELSASARVLVLVGDTWTEGRPVTCSEDTWTAS